MWAIKTKTKQIFIHESNTHFDKNVKYVFAVSSNSKIGNLIIEHLRDWISQRQYDRSLIEDYLVSTFVRFAFALIQNVLF